MSKFKVGGKVRLSARHKAFYDHSVENPHDQVGEIYFVFDNGVIKVKWDTAWNNYTKESLEPVEETPYEIFEPQPFKGFKSIVKGDLVYYFASDDHRETVLKDFEDIAAMCMASIVINKRTNEIVKMRYDLKQFFDEVLK